MNIAIYFQVLEAIAPPYSSEFVQLFLPMVENEEITGTMRGDGDNDLVSEFIGRNYDEKNFSNFKLTFVNFHYILLLYFYYSILQSSEPHCKIIKGLLLND